MGNPSLYLPVAPLLLAYRLLSNRSRVDADIDRSLTVAVRGWGWHPGLMTESRYRQLAPLFRVPAFRSVFYYRVSRSEDVWARRVVGLTRWAYPGPPALSIECDNIGGGLFINHGYSTIVACDSIGEDCEIAHNVTIGWNDDGQLRGPIIGDRVTIYTGAVVAGAITIGHDVKIAANAVVLRDVPAQTTIGGVPGRPLQRSRIRDPRH